jgi:hypothetical protein
MTSNVRHRLTTPIVVIATAAIMVAGHHDALAGYSRGGAFKTPGYGARAWGMAGAAAATVDDEGAVYWNPAMMALAGSKTVGAAYINLVPGATARQSQLAYVHLMRETDYDSDARKVARHAVGALYTNLRLDVEGESYDENTLRLAYAFTPDYFISFAAAGEVFASRSDVKGFGAKGTSVDLAFRLMLTEHFTVGIVARSAFSRYSYNDGADYQREREFALGIARRSAGYVTVEGDVVWAHGDVSRWVLGAETAYLFDLLALRAGIAAITTGESRGVPYFGFGARFRRLTLHYSAGVDDESAFADTHRFTLSVSL